MSSRSLPVILGPEAEDDFADLLLYGVQNWGEQRTAAYEAAIDRALARFGSYPRIGRARPDLAPGCRAFPVKRHMILYRMTADAVEIIRIAYARMDLRMAIPSSYGRRPDREQNGDDRT